MIRIDTTGMQPAVAERIQEARRNVSEHRDSAQAWGALGAVCDIHELYNPAMICYRQAQLLDPVDFRWPYLLGFAMERSGEASQAAMDLYRQAEALNPDYAPVSYRLGELYAGMGKLQDAQEAYLRALKTEPNMAASHYGLGQLLLKQGNASEAMRHLEKAVELVPDDGPSWGALAQAYLQVGDQDQAAQATERARSLGSVATYYDSVRAEVAAYGASSRVAYRRAAQLLAKGSAEDARAAQPYLTILQKVQSKDPYVALWTGIAQLRLGHPEIFAQHIELAETLRNAWSAQSSGVELPQKLAQLDRDMAEGTREYLEYMTTHAPTTQLQVALERFKPVFQRAAPTAIGHLSWGNALLKLGRTQQAVEHYVKAYELDPEYAKAYYNIGYILDRAHRPDEAVPYYQRAAVLNPQGPAAGRLAEILKDRDKKPPGPSASKTPPPIP